METRVYASDIEAPSPVCHARHNGAPEVEALDYVSDSRSLDRLERGCHLYLLKLQPLLLKMSLESNIHILIILIPYGMKTKCSVRSRAKARTTSSLINTNQLPSNTMTRETMTGPRMAFCHRSGEGSADRSMTID